MKRDRNAGFIRRFPHHVPIAIPNRPLGVGSDQLGARQTKLGDTPQLVGRRLRVVIRQASQRREAVRVEFAKLHREVVVDAINDAHGFAVLDAPAEPQNAVNHFSADAVALLIFDAMLRRCRPEHAVRRVGVKSRARLAAQTHGHGRVIEAEVTAAETYVTDVADDLAVMNPGAAVFGIGDPRHPFFPGRRRFRIKQIPGQIPKIQMTIR